MPSWSRLGPCSASNGLACASSSTSPRRFWAPPVSWRPSHFSTGSGVTRNRSLLEAGDDRRQPLAGPGSEPGAHEFVSQLGVAAKHLVGGSLTQVSLGRREGRPFLVRKLGEPREGNRVEIVPGQLVHE